MCKKCKEEYGSCDLFQVYTPVVQHLNKVSSRSSREEPVPAASSDESSTDLLSKDAVVAIAADCNSIDDIWFVQFQKFENRDTATTDDYGHTIPAGLNFLTGHFLERE